MGCASSRQDAAASAPKSRASRTSRASRSDSLEKESNRQLSKATTFKANDRASLMAALDDFDYEGSSSNHTSSTKNSDNPSVICIVRSDKLAFSGRGIRRHSRRKRARHSGMDNTKIIVLRKPSRFEATMPVVDERIPKPLLDMSKLLAEQELKTPNRNRRYPSKKLSPKNVARNLARKKPPKDLGQIMTLRTSTKDILEMSIRSKEFELSKELDDLEEFELKQ